MSPQSSGDDMNEGSTPTKRSLRLQQQADTRQAVALSLAPIAHAASSPVKSANKKDAASPVRSANKKEQKRQRSEQEAAANKKAKTANGKKEGKEEEEDEEEEKEENEVSQRTRVAIAQHDRVAVAHFVLLCCCLQAGTEEEVSGERFVDSTSTRELNSRTVVSSLFVPEQRCSLACITKTRADHGRVAVAEEAEVRCKLRSGQQPGEMERNTN